MKRGYVVCPKCNGTGIMTLENGKEARCSFCFSSGEVPKEKTMQTNEEYIRSCSTEELAELLAKIQTDEYELPVDTAYINAWKSWLKEEHK